VQARDALYADVRLARRGVGEGGSGDLRLKFNKEATPRVASQIWQSGYSARAEVGLVGDDRFRVRVSADGASWRDALNVNLNASGKNGAPTPGFAILPVLEGVLKQDPKP